jgi:hypothetical protein
MAVPGVELSIIVPTFNERENMSWINYQWNAPRKVLLRMPTSRTELPRLYNEILRSDKRIRDSIELSQA